MKTFKDIILEVSAEANPVPRRTKNFIDKHHVQKIDYPVDAENQFTAKKISKDKTKGASYHDGEDSVVYEASMTPADLKQREDIVKGMKKNVQGFKDRYGDRWKSVMYATATKAAVKEAMDPIGKEDSDVNNDGKVNASDKFLKARRKAIAANVKEEAEQIDEISASTLGSYVRKASKDAEKSFANREKAIDNSDSKTARTMGMRARKREHGTDMALDKLKGTKYAKVHATEEAEQIDEAFKAGSMKLNDGSTVTLTKESAESLNGLFDQLNSSNKVKMEERLMSDSKSFDEIIAFAKEV